MMRYIVEFDGIEDFETWSGATSVKDAIERKGCIREANDLLEQLCDNCEDVSEVTVNDYIWFDLANDLREYYDIDIYDEDDLD